MDVLLYIALFQSFITLFFFFLSGVKGKFAKYLLYLLLLPLGHIGERLFLHEVLGISMASYGYAFPTLFLFGPMIYFIYQETRNRFQFDRKTIVHFAPFAISLGFFVFSIREYIVFDDTAAIANYNRIAFPVSLLSFVCYGLYTLRGSYLEMQKLTGVAFHKMRLVRAFSIITLLFPLLSGIVYPMQDSASIILVIGFTLIAFHFLFILYFIFYWERDWEIEIEGEKYGKSALDNEEIDAIRSQVELHFEKNKPYLDCDYSLSELSRELGVPRSDLSQMFSQGLHMRFNAYLNKHRVEHVKKLIRVNGKKSLWHLAIRSGFNSRTTFYRAFKDEEGQTPSEFTGSVHSHVK